MHKHMAQVDSAQLTASKQLDIAIVIYQDVWPE